MGRDEMMEVRPVSYAEILNAPNASILFAAYGAECSIPEIGEVNPQAEMYAKMEASGMFQAFAALKGEELVGFATILIWVVPHYGKQIASVESIFLSPVHRSGRTGNVLMNAIEQYAKGRGCEVIQYSARAGSNFERILHMLKPYQRTNSIFLRRLLT